MFCSVVPDTPVYSGGILIGWLADEDARDVMRKKEGRLEGAGTKKRRIVLNEAAVPRVRALCNTSTQSALSPTQQEELYSGLRKDGTDGPVTKVITVVRKVRVNKFGERSLENWRENERFPRRRFNPDRIPAPMFQSPAAYKASSLNAGTTVYFAANAGSPHA